MMEQLENYIQDEVYTLTIKTGVQAKNGRALKKEVTLDFILNGTDLKIIDMQPAIDDYMAALQNKVKELEGKLDEKDTKIAELTTSVDEKDTKIAELTTSVDEKDTKIAELTTSVDEKDTKIAELTTSVDEKDTKIAELT
ncbi:hypothetical protein L2D08_19355, partial [Domibacillus sp. PGB-M46]|uniref:hypothetical protein n=1 Tax=Domibacillus sp. PGB-M46 TaxID=2910255 RepID=UPI001F599AEE